MKSTNVSLSFQADFCFHREIFRAPYLNTMSIIGNTRMAYYPVIIFFQHRLFLS